MKKRILVMYARYGSGHKRIAEYVANYIEEHNKEIEVMLLDMTDYANKYGKVSLKLFDFVLNKRAERLFDICYEIMDHKIFLFNQDVVTKKCYNSKELQKIIQKFNPDVTISTHFFCSSIINHYNKKDIIDSKLLTIITDYRTHEWWTKNHKYEDGYIVGNEIVKNELIKRGVSSKKIYVYGLPLDIREINNLDDKLMVKKKYGILNNKKIYLFFGGSTAGSMYYYDYFKAICKLNIDGNIIFISGKNEKLKISCDKYINKNNIKNIKVLGYSTDVFNLMNISDLIISKPGGATITESLEMHKPLLLVPGIGGQEKYNAKFIAKNKYGIRIRNLREFKKWILKLEKNPEIIKKFKINLDNQNKNHSVEKINNLIMKL